MYRRVLSDWLQAIPMNELSKFHLFRFEVAEQNEDLDYILKLIKILYPSKMCL